MQQNLFTYLDSHTQQTYLNPSTKNHASIQIQIPVKQILSGILKNCQLERASDDAQLLKHYRAMHTVSPSQQERNKFGKTKQKYIR